MSGTTDGKMAVLLARFARLQERMSENVDPETYVRLSRECGKLQPIVEKIQAVEALRREKGELEEILSDRSGDGAVQELAREELASLAEQIPRVEHDLKILLLPKDEDDERGAILELRAGTGGEEAALFVSDLFRMYKRYADLCSWKIDVLSASETERGGYREIIATVEGPAVYGRLKYESGVHRVQRVPTTEASGRVHTSAVTVAVLPEAEEVDVRVDEKDLRIDVYRASGAGGQHVNKTDSAVRITHLPTGAVVAVQDARSQHRNRARAMQLLRAKLYDACRFEAEKERAAERRNLVGSGDRSQRIRTYNFSQDRLTDHRINLTLYKLEHILEGEALGEVIDALVTENEAARLAAFGG